MSKRFNDHFEVVVSGLKDFYGVLANAALVADLKEAIRPLHRDTGNDQSDYEHLRDQLEARVTNLSWDDVPAEDQHQLIQALGKGTDYQPTEEELNVLWEQWYEPHQR